MFCALCYVMLSVMNKKFKSDGEFHIVTTLIDGTIAQDVCLEGSCAWQYFADLVYIFCNQSSSLVDTICLTDNRYVTLSTFKINYKTKSYVNRESKV